MGTRKPQQPAITVKSGNDAGGVRACWIVRVDGLQVATYGADEDARRRALRYRDALVASWKAWARSRTTTAPWDFSKVEA